MHEKTASNPMISMDHILENNLGSWTSDHTGH